MENQLTVLIVDDEEDIRSTTADYLQMRGFAVLSAGSAAEAIERAAEAEFPIAVLVTDFVLPDMSGMDLSTHLAAAFPNLQTLYITGFGNNVVVSGELASDNAQWLGKPVNLRVLEAEINKMLVSFAIGSTTA